KFRSRSGGQGNGGGAGERLHQARVGAGRGVAEDPLRPTAFSAFLTGLDGDPRIAIWPRLYKAIIAGSSLPGRYRRADLRTNDFAGDDQLYAPVLLPARSGVIRGYRLSLPKALRSNRTCGHSRAGKIVAYRGAALFREPL